MDLFKSQNKTRQNKTKQNKTLCALDRKNGNMNQKKNVRKEALLNEVVDSIAR